MSSMVFSDDDPRYKCCCTNCHATTGVKIICQSEGILLLLIIYVLVSASGSSALSVSGGVGIALLVAGIGLALYGAFARKASFIVPHMILQVLAICALLLFAFLFTALGLAGMMGADVFVSHMTTTKNVTLTNDEMTMTQMNRQSLAVFLVISVLFFVVAGVEVWFVLVFLSAYRYLKERAPYICARPAATTTVVPQNPSHQQRPYAPPPHAPAYPMPMAAEPSAPPSAPPLGFQMTQVPIADAPPPYEQVVESKGNTKM